MNKEYNVVLNDGVGVYTLNSGVVIVLEGVHKDEPFIEWIELL